MFRQGDIYMVTLDPAIGHEQQGTRPVLVISSERFNASATVPIVLPITSGGAFARNRGFAVPLPLGQTSTRGVVLCHQPRSLDLAARNARFLERAPDDLTEEARLRAIALLSN